MAGGNSTLDGTSSVPPGPTTPAEADTQPTDAGFSDDDSAVDAIFNDLQAEVDRILGGTSNASS